VGRSGRRAPASRSDLADGQSDSRGVGSTFASRALAAGVTVFELAKVMGTSVRMIERHYGALLDGAHAGIASRLDAFDATAANAAEAEAQS
jgi:hypothetical protein